MNFVIAIFSLLSITVANSSADQQNSTKSYTIPNDEPERIPRFEGSVCPHKDYRSYVKCLQTHRRHEHHPQATSSRGTSGGGTNCVEECERESCRHQGSGSCTEVCYDRCLRKTKEIHHKITEYETTCGEGEDCGNAGKSGPARGPPLITNLTTSIDIRNYVNNTNVILHSDSKTDQGDHSDTGRGNRKDQENRDRGVWNNTCKTGQLGCDGTGTGGEGRTGLVPPSGFQPFYPAPSLALIPQIQMVPQVTFGLGIAPGAGFGSFGNGCPYTTVWLCFPQQQQRQQQQPQQVRDCSGCVQPYPYSRGRCDPSC